MKYILRQRMVSGLRLRLRPRRQVSGVRGVISETTGSNTDTAGSNTHNHNSDHFYFRGQHEY